EGPLAVFAPERTDLPCHQGRKERRKHGIQPQQQRIVACEHRRVAACRGKQKQQYAGQCGAEKDQQPHRVSTSFGSRLSTGAGVGGGGRKLKRFHGDSRFRSRLVSALNWNGFGNSVTSSRMRTAAS